MWKRLTEVLDQCAAPLVGFAALPFAVDGKNVWHLATGVLQRQPAQWSIRRIISSFVKGGIRYFEVEWENTIEPMAGVPAHFIRQFNHSHHREFEQAFVETETVEERTDKVV
jgi:hypothetical protein